MSLIVWENNRLMADRQHVTMGAAGTLLRRYEHRKLQLFPKLDAAIAITGAAPSDPKQYRKSLKRIVKKILADTKGSFESAYFPKDSEIEGLTHIAGTLYHFTKRGEETTITYTAVDKSGDYYLGSGWFLAKAIKIKYRNKPLNAKALFRSISRKMVTVSETFDIVEY